jgi:hypothetical protein
MNKILMTVLALLLLEARAKTVIKYDYWYGAKLSVALKELPRDKESSVSSASVKVAGRHYMVLMGYTTPGFAYLVDFTLVSFYDKDGFEVGTLYDPSGLTTGLTYDLEIKGAEPPTSIVPSSGYRCLTGYHDAPLCISDSGMVIIVGVWDSLPANSWKVDNNTYRCNDGFAEGFEGKCLSKDQVRCTDAARTLMLDTVQGQAVWRCRAIPANAHWDSWVGQSVCDTGAAILNGKCELSAQCPSGAPAYVEKEGTHNAYWSCPYIPANAHWNGNALECNEGYFYTGGGATPSNPIICSKDDPKGGPPNAHWDEHLSKWSCDNGYVAAHGGCSAPESGRPPIREACSSGFEVNNKCMEREQYESTGAGRNSNTSFGPRALFILVTVAAVATVILLGAK